MKRNIIYIHTHDSGKEFGLYNHNLETPNLCAFAQEGIVFDQAFCTSPTCSPSRSSLLTGKYPHKNKMIGLGNRGFELEDYTDHLVNILKKNSYTTVLAGIQHEYGHYKDRNGYQTIGYDYCVSDDYNKYRSEDLNIWDQTNVDNLALFLKEYDYQKPLFISFGFHSTHRKFPHSSQIYPKPLPAWLIDSPKTRQDYSDYYQSLVNFDQTFQDLINVLKQYNLYDDSTIIFTTDHGIAFPEAKCTLRDSGIEVALVVKTPEAKYHGRYQKIISQIDLVPTLVDLLNLDCTCQLDGISFKKCLADPNYRVRDYILAEINFHCAYEPCRCIRTENYKYIVYYGNYQQRKLANIDNSLSKDYYLANDLLLPRYKNELYDLVKDKHEKSNVTFEDDYQKVKDDIRHLLYEKQIEFDDDILEGLAFKQQNWIVNKNECLDPHSKNPYDLI